MKITAYGEIVWDIFDDVKKLGGAPLNFTYFCSKRGAEANIISSVGNDENGRNALSIIRENGLSTDFIAVDPTHATGTVKVELSDTGVPQYDIKKNAAWDYIEVSDAALKLVRSSDAFLFGTLAQRSEISKKTLWKIIAVLPQECVVVFDANLRQNYFDAEMLKKSLSAADILKINEDELAIIRNLFIPQDADQHPCDFLIEHFALKYIILTLGPDGYKIFTRKGNYSGDAIDVKIVDTVGAGDSFMATFLTDILLAKSTEEAANNANQVAALVCSRRGAFCL